jgi:acyl carrier protein phosphodiesterase
MKMAKIKTPGSEKKLGRYQEKKRAGIVPLLYSAEVRSCIAAVRANKKEEYDRASRAFWRRYPDMVREAERKRRFANAAQEPEMDEVA